MKSHIEEKLAEAKVGFSSRANLYEYLQTKGHPAKGEEALYNEDLLPTPPDQRTWGTLHYFAFYMTTTFSPSSYNLGATLVSIGLLWWHGLIAAVIGSVILTIFLVFNSRGSTKYHIGFPTFVRASAGIGGSKLFVCVRAIVAVIYFSTQTYYAGRLTSVMLYAIIGPKWRDIPNKLPADAGITSQNLLAFMIFWIIQFPVMFVHPRHMRWVYVFKAIYAPASLFGVLGWCVSHNGGSLGNITGLGTKHAEGSQLVWAMLQAINSVMAALCPILINAPDIARYAKRTDSTWSAQFGAILISKVLVMFLGCATTSAAAGFLGKTYWNVWDLYTAILENFWSPAARAGIVFASLGMILSVLATNAGTNSLPVGADMAGIAPRWINIRRGQVACALLAPLLVPWKIIANASTFLTFLGSYTVFLCPIMAIMIVDYFLIRKGNMHIPSLYDGSDNGLYHFYRGWNLRAMVAWVCGVAFTVHGVAGNINPDSVNQASKNMYRLGFLLSTIMGGCVYLLLCTIWPPRLLPTGRENEVLGFEGLARTEGFFEGESLSDVTGHLEGVPGSENDSEVVYENKIVDMEKRV